jgi:4-aminobutyrate--pyruvate transaminase
MRSANSKKKIIERMASYHGITVPPPAFRGKPSMHADFGMTPPMIRHTEFSTLYWNHIKDESVEAFAIRMADPFEKLFLEERGQKPSPLLPSR